MRCAAAAAFRSTRRCKPTCPASAAQRPRVRRLRLRRASCRPAAVRPTSKRATPWACWTRSRRPTSHERVGDGLPETLEEVIQACGHRYFKLKVGGQTRRRPGAAGSHRRRARPARPQPYFVSLDGNEQYSDAQGVAELVAGIRARPALARLWNSILFIEQPIARKLALDTDLRAAGLGKPVIIDESDGELDTFVRGSRARLPGRFVQDLQGPVQVDSQRRALRAAGTRRKARRAISCRPKT